jgi:predicted transglutaminase-like cysteine proteinase
LALAVLAPSGLAAVIGLLAHAGLDPLRDALNRVNIRTKHELTFQPGIQWSFGSVGDCTTFALHNYLVLRTLGLRPKIWSVVDEKGEGHAVVAVGDDVLDNRFWRMRTRTDLERLGYRFRTPVEYLVLVPPPSLASR